MAKITTASSSEPTKQLRKLLQNQQEPFTLEVYLSEKGCVRKNLTSDPHFILGSGNFLNKSCTKNKSKKGIVPHFPKVLRLVLCNMFFTIKGLRTKSSNKQETIEADNRFSSSSCSTLNNSSSDSHMDESSMFTHNSNSSKLYAEKGNKVKRAVVETMFQCSTTCVDRKQHSPQSILEEISSSSSSSTDDETISSTEQESFVLPKLITEESILSATLWSLLLQTTAKEQSGCEGFSTSKRVLQQTKQLLLDCVRELVDHGKQGEGKRLLGGEEIGNLICEKIKGWWKQCGDETNIKEMLELDVMESKHEWNDFEVESQKREIGQVLGNTLLEELTSEIVTDMIDLFFK